ncbi:ATP-grasp domain-containing protein [Amycolatopsis sp. NBC_00345]|uniref:preATP grasp domain-containing protein n=1 Tax=Amycolatopsis sp. NBC_00345 TaxID=2975955 RepID=UPI002E26963F
MYHARPAFLRRLRSALRADDSAPLVFLGNFEVERQWGWGEPGLPTFSTQASDLVVNRMDEFTVTLGGPDDVVVLKENPDPAYLDYLTTLGWRPPRILVPGVNDPSRSVSDDALGDRSLLEELSGLRDSGAVIVPHGVSVREEQLAEATGLPLGTPGAAVCKAVNSKVYSRRLADELRLRQPAGRWCDTLDRWKEAAEWAYDVVEGGGRVAVKDAYGVSGKGILQLATTSRIAQLTRMFTRRRDRTGDERLAVVVEEWVPKSTDLNYQFTISRDGGIELDFVKESLTRSGVHLGHLFPARLSGTQRQEVADTAQRVGEALAADGYFGVVGVDAMIDPDGGVYPIVEINARNNMSTYQESLWELVGGPGRTAVAKHYAIQLDAPLPFTKLREGLGSALLGPGSEAGLLINNYATVNSGLSAGGAGRLYGMLVGPDLATVEDTDHEIAAALAAWQKGGRR